MCLVSLTVSKALFVLQADHASAHVLSSFDNIVIIVEGKIFSFSYSFTLLLIFVVV